MAKLVLHDNTQESAFTTIVDTVDRLGSRFAGVAVKARGRLSSELGHWSKDNVA
jgi:hypothetical protein